MFSINHPDGAVKTSRTFSQNPGTLPARLAKLFVNIVLILIAFICAFAGTVVSAMDGIPIIVAGKQSGFFMPRVKDYYRRVMSSKHFLRKPMAITNDIAALALAEDMGAQRVRILDSDTGCEYLCMIPIIQQYGFHIDRGFGKQIALPLPYWIKVDPDGTVHPATLPKAAPVATVEAAQPALFDFAEPVKRSGY